MPENGRTSRPGGALCHPANGSDAGLSVRRNERQEAARSGGKVRNGGKSGLIPALQGGI